MRKIQVLTGTNRFHGKNLPYLTVVTEFDPARSTEIELPSYLWKSSDDTALSNYLYHQRPLNLHYSARDMLRAGQ